MSFGNHRKNGNLKPLPSKLCTYSTDLSAIILAGGLGTRLRKIVNDRPKVLAEVAGRPFLAYLLDYLRGEGIGRVVLCTGYLADQIHQVFGQEYEGVELIYSREAEPLGTGGALRLASRCISAFPVLVCNGDSFADVPLEGLWDFHEAHGAEATIGVMKCDDPRRFGLVNFNDFGEVQNFSEKKTTAQTGWVNAGMYVVGKELVDSIPENGKVSLENDIFPSWVGRGLFAYPQLGSFFDIGTPESLDCADNFFHQRQKAPDRDLVLAHRDRDIS